MGKNLEERLRQETKKWLDKIKKERKNVIILDNEKQGLLANIDAYINDCEHFLEEGMLIEAFEAVIWAWSWTEILKELGIAKSNGSG